MAHIQQEAFVNHPLYEVVGLLVNCQHHWKYLDKVGYDWHELGKYNYLGGFLPKTSVTRRPWVAKIILGLSVVGWAEIKVTRRTYFWQLWVRINHKQQYLLMNLGMVHMNSMPRMLWDQPGWEGALGAFLLVIVHSTQLWRTTKSKCELTTSYDLSPNGFNEVSSVLVMVY